jgi:CMP-N,N'-diacetyllegionaminic acid synthase
MKKEITIAIIPARGGSTGILRKNVKLLGGKPLVTYVIEAAKNSGVVDKVFVSTDDNEIAKISKKFGAEVVPQEGVEGEQNNIIKYNLAKDSYLQSGIIEIEKKGYKIKDVIFIQATSPLTTPEDIKLAYEVYKNEKYDSLLSVTKSAGGFKCGGFVWDDKGNSLNYDYKNRKRRQELPTTYLENGAFYIFSRDGIKKYENRLHGKIGYYVMPDIRSFEIDEPEDWEILELLLNYINKKKNEK